MGLPATEKDAARDGEDGVEQLFISDLEKREFADRFKDRKAQALDAALQAKFKADVGRKKEVKTVQLLLDEVIDQVRAWSGKHAGLLQELFQRKEALRQSNLKLVKKQAHVVKDKLSKALVLLATRLEQTQRELDYS